MPRETVEAIERKIASLRREMRGTLDRGKLACLRSKIGEEVAKLQDDPRKRAENLSPRDAARRRLRLLRI